MSTTFRFARAEDAERVARLHADSWRRHYRGAYADAYLDGDVLTDRVRLWTARLAEPGHTATILAEPVEPSEPAERSEPGDLVGFVHVVLDDDERWGSLVDNLHVTHARQRSGVGRALLGLAARSVLGRATRPAMYLWVLEQNTNAQGFYAALGGRNVERSIVSAPGGVPGRLNGTPGKFRYVWPDAAVVGSGRAPFVVRSSSSEEPRGAQP